MNRNTYISLIWKLPAWKFQPSCVNTYITFSLSSYSIWFQSNYIFRVFTAVLFSYIMRLKILFISCHITMTLKESHIEMLNIFYIVDRSHHVERIFKETILNTLYHMCNLLNTIKNTLWNLIRIKSWTKLIIAWESLMKLGLKKKITQTQFEVSKFEASKWSFQL